MSTIQVDILNPKAGKLLKDLADLNLISIREVSANDGLAETLKKNGLHCSAMIRIAVFL